MRVRFISLLQVMILNRTCSFLRHDHTTVVPVNYLHGSANITDQITLLRCLIHQLNKLLSNSYSSVLREGISKRIGIQPWLKLNKRSKGSILPCICEVNGGNFEMPLTILNLGYFTHYCSAIKKLYPTHRIKLFLTTHQLRHRMHRNRLKLLNQNTINLL